MSATTAFCIDEKAADRQGRLAALMAEMRGDGGPPDGHDPEAHPGSAPLLAKVIWMVIIMVTCSSCRFGPATGMPCHEVR